MRLHLLSATAMATALFASSVVLTVTPGQAAFAGGSSNQDSASLAERPTMSAGSSNGDGVKDVGVIRYTLPRPASRVRIKIYSGDNLRSPVLRSVRLGEVGRGSHAWLWDGLDDRGHAVPDARYLVVLSKKAGGQKVWDRIVVDTSISPQISADAYGGRVPTAYPRATEVDDALLITTGDQASNADLIRSELTIRDTRDRVVLRQTARYGPDSKTDFVTYPWTARKDGESLAPGRYWAVVKSTDRAGNVRRSKPLQLRVSGEKLTWQERVHVLSPAAVRRDACDSSGRLCVDQPRPCGEVVASSLYDGGLSYQSRECPPPGPYASGVAEAQGVHSLQVPETVGVRGIDSAKVAFSGRPTTADETDTGTVKTYDYETSKYVTASGSTGAEIAWAGCSGTGCEELFPHQLDRPNGVVWVFSTHGTDSVDVETFTVTVRYLAVAE